MKHEPKIEDLLSIWARWASADPGEDIGYPRSASLGGAPGSSSTYTPEDDAVMMRIDACVAALPRVNRWIIHAYFRKRKNHLRIARDLKIWVSQVAPLLDDSIRKVGVSFYAGLNDSMAKNTVDCTQNKQIYLYA